MQPEVEVLKAQYPALERFEAVNGSSIDVATDTRISVRTKRNILKGERRAHDELESAGGVGCSLSHIEIWKKFMDSPEPYLIVFEDDAVIPLGFTRNLQAAMKEVNRLPKSPDIWWFDEIIWLQDSKLDPRMSEYRAHHIGNWITDTCAATGGYMLTKASAQKLLETALPIEMHIDSYICMIRVLNNFLTVFHRNVTIKQNSLVETDIHLGKECAICDIPNNYRSRGMIVVELPALAIGIAALAGLWWLSGATRRRR